MAGMLELYLPYFSVRRIRNKNKVSGLHIIAD